MVKKYFFVLCLILLMLLPCIWASADDGDTVINVTDVEDFQSMHPYEEYFDVEDGCILSYEGDDTSVYVPPVINGEQITSIGRYSFSNSNIEFIELPEGILTIEKGAFEGCSSLTEITIPDSVTTIDEKAFYGCSSATQLTLGVNLSAVGKDAFANCSSIEKIFWNSKSITSYSFAFENSGSDEGVELFYGNSVEVIPSGLGEYLQSRITHIDIGTNVSEIKSYAFQYCTSVKELVVPESVKSVGDFVFSKMHSLENIYINSTFKISSFYSNPSVFTDAGSTSPIGLTIHLGGNIDTIPEKMFKSSLHLKKVVLPDSVTIIENYAFNSCSKLETVIGGKNVKTIGDYAFNSCSLLSEIPDMKAVESVGEKAFYNCSAVVDFKFLSVLHSIGKSAFEGCTSLKKITLGKNLTSISDFAFKNCTGTDTIFVSAQLDDFTNKSHIFSGCGTSSDGIRVVIGENIKVIPAYIFYGANYYIGNYTQGYTHFDYTWPNIVSLHIGSNVEKINSWAFGACLYLKAVTGGGAVTTIESGAFNNCSSLAYFKFSDNIKTIGSLAFSYSGFKEIILPEGLESLGLWAFEGCSSAQIISVPASVTYIDADRPVFSGCNSLKTLYWNTNAFGSVDFSASPGYEIIFGDNVTEIKSNLFDNTNVTKITLGKNVEKICDGAFQGCRYLETVNLNDKLTFIDNNAFYDCPISEIDLKNVEIISDYAFYGCSNISEVDLSRLIKIGISAFGESGIKAVYAPELRHISSYAFANSKQLASVNIPKIEYIDSYAFNGCESLSVLNLSKFISHIGNYAFGGCAGLKAVLVYSEEARKSSAFNYGTVLNYYSEDYMDIVKEDRLDDYEGLIGQAVKPDKIKLICQTTAALGDIFAIDKEYEPISATDCVTVWSSDNTDVATVENGIVTCHSVGNAHIVADCSNGTSDFIYLTVTNSQLDILCNKSQLVVGTGDELTVYASFFSKENSPEDAVWAISDTSLANVKNSGYNMNSDGSWTLYALITGTAQGITDISVRINEIEDTLPLHVGAYPDKVCEYIVVDEDRNPIAGAVITVDGYETVTDQNGSASLMKSLFAGKRYVDVEVSCSGYATKMTQTPVYETGATYIKLDTVTDDVIFADLLINAGGSVRSLLDPNTNVVYISPTEESKEEIGDCIVPTSIFANVVWGNNDQGTIELIVDRTGEKLPFENNTVDIIMPRDFKPGDTFRIKASALSPKGQRVTAEMKLPISIIEYDMDIIPSTDGNLSFGELPGFKGLNFNMDIEGLNKLFTIEVEDGVLFLTAPKIKGNIKIFGDKELETSLYSGIKYPLLNPVNPEFSGALKFEAEVEDLIELPAINETVPVAGIPVPITGSISMDVALESEVEVKGILNEPYYEGSIDPKVNFDVFGGLGRDYGETALKAGVYLAVEPDFRFEFINSLKPHFNPRVDINFGYRFEGKLFGEGVETSYNIINAGYADGKWRGVGFDGSSNIEMDGTLGKIEIQPASEDVSTWQLLDRSYISEDTGFYGYGGISLFGLNRDNKTETLMYKDMISASESKLTHINGGKTLLYTVDDEKHEIQNGLTLMYTTQNSDGIWSDPIPVHDDGTADSAVNTHGNFVIWENVKSELDSDVTLPQYLSKTEISAAKIMPDGSINVYQLTDNEIYDSAPDIISTSTGAIAAWVSNSENDILRRSGENTLKYSIYDGTAWSAPHEVCTVDEIGSSYIEISRGKGYIFYNDGGEVHSYCIQDTSNIVVADDVLRYSTYSFDDKIAFAYYDKDNKLYYTEDILHNSPSLIDTDTGNFNLYENPDIITNGEETYILWTGKENGRDTLEGVRKSDNVWSKVICFSSTEESYKNPSIVINDDVSLSMSYYTQHIDIDTTGNVNITDCSLYVCDIVPSYDIAVNQESVEFTGITDDEICFNLNISNTGELNIDSYEINVFNGNELIKRFTVEEILLAGDEAVFSNSFEFENLAKEYTITVKPLGVTDYDESDNTASLITLKNDIALSEAYFSREFDKTYLNVVVSNEGTHALSSAVITIKEQNKYGKTILQTDAERLSAGEAQLYKFDMSSFDGKQVYIYAYVQSDTNDFNNSAIAYRIDKIQTESEKKESIKLSGVPVNQDNIAISECTYSDIGSVDVYVDSTVAQEAAACIVCIDSSDNYIKSYIVTYDIKPGSNLIQLSKTDIPQNTYSISFLLWNRNNLRPLIDSNIYNLILQD